MPFWRVNVTGTGWKKLPDSVHHMVRKEALNTPNNPCNNLLQRLCGKWAQSPEK